MSEEIFLRNSAYIQQLLSQQPSDQSAFPLEHVFGLVKYSVGSWIKTAAVMSAGYFDRELVTEEPEEPIIEPLEAERDDEILANQEVVTPEEGEDDIVGEDDATPLDEEPEEEELAPAFEELQADQWQPVTDCIDQYFSFINRLVMFSPEMHKDRWRAFTEQTESILSKASLTPSGLATRFKLVEDLYKATAAA